MNNEDELGREETPESPRDSGTESLSGEEIIERLKANLAWLQADANVRILRAIRQRERSWTMSAT